MNILPIRCNSKCTVSIVPFLVLLCLLLNPVVSIAKDNCIGDCYSCHSLSVKEATGLTKSLGVTVKAVTPSHIKGLFEVQAVRDSKEGIVFVDFAKKYLMQGVMVAIDDVNAEQHPKPSQQDVPALLKMNSVLLGNPEASTQIFVFSDPDCAFCRQMHDELLQLIADKDIAVYIKPYPLGNHLEAFDKARSILEANSLEVLNKAFAGEPIPPPKDPKSKEAVDDIIALAKALGIKGTPAFLLPKGKIEVGFRSAAELRKIIFMQ